MTSLFHVPPTAPVPPETTTAPLLTTSWLKPTTRELFTSTALRLVQREPEPVTSTSLLIGTVPRIRSPPGGDTAIVAAHHAAGLDDHPIAVIFIGEFQVELVGPNR